MTMEVAEVKEAIYNNTKLQNISMEEEAVQQTKKWDNQLELPNMNLITTVNLSSAPNQAEVQQEE